MKIYLNELTCDNFVVVVNRYFAIVHPLDMMHWMQSYRMQIIAAIWAVSGIFGMFQWWVTKVFEYTRFKISVAYCGENWSAPEYSRYWSVIITVITLVIPLTILFFVYITIFVRILQHVTPGNPDSIRDKQYFRRKLKVCQGIKIFLPKNKELDKKNIIFVIKLCFIQIIL